MEEGEVEVGAESQKFMSDRRVGEREDDDAKVFKLLVFQEIEGNLLV